MAGSWAISSSSRPQTDEVAWAAQQWFNTSSTPPWAGGAAVSTGGDHGLLAVAPAACGSPPVQSSLTASPVAPHSHSYTTPTTLPQSHGAHAVPLTSLISSASSHDPPSVPWLADQDLLRHPQVMAPSLAWQLAWIISTVQCRVPSCQSLSL